MDIIKDLIGVNKYSLKKTLETLSKNPILFFVGLAYSLINIVVYMLIGIFFVGPLRVFAGFVSLIIMSALISNYLYLLYNAINFNRVTIKNFKDGFNYFLGKIYGVFFIGWIFNMLIGLLNNLIGGRSDLLSTIISLSILLLLNALPETIYLKSYSSLDTISNSLEFIERNPLNWILPNIVLSLAMYLLTGEIFGNLSQTHINISSMLGTSQLIKTILAQIIFTFGMVYRGHLYKVLSSGNRRKRKFMNKF